jgi:Holliday junction resolvasome RuvABC ATP-dependent DNA helicase subunit
MFDFLKELNDMGGIAPTRSTTSPDSVAMMQANGGHPTTWDSFIGQDRVKDMLRVAAASARKRGASMGHMIIVSPEPGSGKTTLALLAAAEAGARAKIVKGVVTESQALSYLDELGDGGVLIWDEFQQAVSGGVRHIEWLYHFAQHGVFMDGDTMIPAPKVTIICATTHLGEIPTAVKQRFAVLNLARYSASEASRIAYSTWKHVAEGCGLPLPDDETCEAVARAASHRPRNMQRIWEKVRDLALNERIPVDVNEDEEWSVDLTLPLEWAEFTEDGLTVNCIKYMAFLLKQTRVRGRDAITNATGIGKNDLVETETLLLEKRYMEDTGMGRKLTMTGKRRFNELVAVAA